MPDWQYPGDGAHDQQPFGQQPNPQQPRHERRFPIYIPAPPAPEPPEEKKKIRWGRIIAVSLLLIVVLPFIYKFLFFIQDILSEPPRRYFDDDQLRLIGWAIITGLVVGGLIRLLRKI